VDGTVEAARFQAALAMAETGVRLMRQRLRRDDPDVSELEIDAMLRGWLTGRSMDAPGRVRVLSPR
jgi:hypothetical protein